MLPTRKILLPLCLCAMIFICAVYEIDVPLRSMEKNRLIASYAGSSLNKVVYSEGALHFPTDEGSHGTNFEWWYITSHFTTRKGNRYTCTVAYTNPYYLENTMHCDRLVSITDETNKRYFGQLLVGNFTSQARSLNLTYKNQNGDYDYWFQKESELFNYSLSVEVKEVFSLNATLSANKPPLLQGGNGVIPMGYGGNSYYYSQTNLSLNGIFDNIVNNTTEEISGVAWIDHQWGNWSSDGYDGWEWFAIQLNDTSEIMVGSFFDPVTRERIPESVFASILFNDGSTYYSENGDVTLVNLDYFELQETKRTYSSGWRITIKRFNIELTIIPTVRDQTAGHIWEGSCYVTGKYNNTIADGICTAELTHNYYGTNYFVSTNYFVFVFIVLFLAVLGTVVLVSKSKAN
jgi:predicted secreted hydrolase